MDEALRPPKRRRGRPPASPEDLQIARDRICDAALMLFDRGGIEAISMREIAGEIGVSQMMAYTYFPTKDHLLQELRSRAFMALEGALLAGAAGAKSPRERLKQVLIAYLRFGLKERRSYRLMFDYWAYDNAARMIDDFGDAIRRQAGAWNVLLAAVEAELSDADTPQDTLTTAHLIWASLHGLVSLEASRKLAFGKRFEQLMLPLVDGIMIGIGSSADSSPSAT
jgi:AcrR family transcriptional regulator